MHGGCPRISVIRVWLSCGPLPTVLHDAATAFPLCRRRECQFSVQVCQTLGYACPPGESSRHTSEGMYLHRARRSNIRRTEDTAAQLKEPYVWIIKPSDRPRLLIVPCHTSLSVLARIGAHSHEDQKPRPSPCALVTEHVCSVNRC